MWIKSLELENWRGYPGEQIIEFSNDPKKPVTIVHAENGHGKTSLLAALKWVLHKDLPMGVSKDSLIDEGVKQEKKNKAMAKVSMVIVKEDSELSEDQVKEYKISRSINADNIESDVKIQPWKSGGWGVFEGKEQAFIEQQILPKALSDIFLFNGEDLSESFKTSNKKRLEESVLKVTGILAADETIAHLESFKKDLEDELNMVTNKSATDANAKKEFNQLKKEYDALVAKISEKEGDLLEATEKKETAQEELGKLQNPTLDAAIQDMKDARTELNNVKPEIVTKKNEFRKYINDYRFSLSLQTMVFPTVQEVIKNTDSFPLPITPPDRKDAFLKALSEADECICGTSFEKLPGFEEKIKNYLDNEGLKDEIDRTYQGLQTYKENNKNSSKSFLDITTELENSINNLEKTKNKAQEKYDDSLETVGANAEEDQKDREAAIQDLQNDFISAEKAEGDLEIELNDPITGLKRLKSDKKKNYDAKKGKLKTDDFSAQINLLNKKINFIQKVINRLIVEKGILTNNMKAKISDYANEFLKKYYKLGARFEYEDDSYIPLLVTEGFGKEVDLSGGNRTLKSIFYGASLVAAAESRESETNHIIDKGVKAAWVVDAPFSKLDGANIISCAKVILDRKRQLIVFVNNEDYLQGFEKELKKLKTLGKQFLIKRFIKGKPGTDAVLDVFINNKKVKCVGQSKSDFPYSEIIKV